MCTPHLTFIILFEQLVGLMWTLLIHTEHFEWSTSVFLGYRDDGNHPYTNCILNVLRFKSMLVFFWSLKKTRIGLKSQHHIPWRCVDNFLCFPAQVEVCFSPDLQGQAKPVSLSPLTCVNLCNESKFLTYTPSHKKDSNLVYHTFFYHSLSVCSMERKLKLDTS